MCVNNHDPNLMETRPSGARVCTACREMYSVQRRIRGAQIKSLSTPRESENNHARNNR